MHISMIVDFQILKKQNGKFMPLSKEEIQNLSIGGYSFEIGEDLIPFDWDASSGNEEDNVFHFETGCGPFWNDYEIPDYYDEEYKEIGIKREEITAEFLASVHHIEDFFVNFDDSDGKEHGIGWYGDNINNSQYKINIIKLTFLDLMTQNEYAVAQNVIDKYNKGE